MKRWMIAGVVAAALLRTNATNAGNLVPVADTPSGWRAVLPHCQALRSNALHGSPPGRTGCAADEPADPPAEAEATAEESPAATPPDEAPPAWSLSASVAIYVVPDTDVYAQPTFIADYEWLHLEGRLNYEAIDAASLWLGYNFSIGDKLTLDFTPMVGGVFGDIDGIAPGARLSLGFWKLDLYSEAEYFFDTDDHDGNFGYTWSELGLTPVDWLRLGLVGQRTNAYDTDVDIQRGLFAGLTYRGFSLTTYVFNLDQSEQTVVISMGA